MIVRAGQRFGRLITVSQAGVSSDKHRLWLCLCDCGSECTRQSNNLKASGMPSCGCAQSALQTKHGQRGTPTYSSWQAAKRRCHNQDDKDFPRYGARGVQVCAEWRESFEAFHAYMGDRPSGTTLDRWPNSHGDYEPGNCRWATPTEQARNRRTTVVVDWGGKPTPLSVVAEQLGITFGAAYMRHQRGRLS